MEAIRTKHEVHSVEKAEHAEDTSHDSFVVPTADEEAAVLRKMDWRLMPIIFTIYMLSVLDRSNLGNAHVAGLDESINLSSSNYNMLGTVFYIGCKLLRHNQCSDSTLTIFQIFFRSGLQQDGNNFRLIFGARVLCLRGRQSHQYRPRCTIMQD